MLHSGLVSITFRQLTPEQIIDLCVEAKIEGIEWGGDIHVPHGNIDVATRIGTLTRAAGIATPTYGSYDRAGKSEADGLRFVDVLNSAIALGTPAIRVWAGTMDSAGADEAEWTRPDRDRYVLMEYVLNDSPEQFKADAAVFNQWLTAATG